VRFFGHQKKNLTEGFEGAVNGGSPAHHENC
jgi:hypothetical protein